jgi:tetratricopeptide (TPR) repeat protein
MPKRFIVLSSLIITGFVARAQTPSADSVYNQYVDFNLARFQGETDKALELGENILPYADKLPEKARINFYFSVGKMYEDNDEHNKALPYYEKVAAAVPDYYVAHRALGYLYLEKVNDLEDKLKAAGGNDAALNQQLDAMVRKALPHLEKAQACDPSDETLAVIKRLYGDIKDEQDLSTLDSRLKALSKNCIDILTDK